MSIVEIERGEGIMVIRMNRPDRLNALGMELRAALADAWCEFEKVVIWRAIFTGTGFLRRRGYEEPSAAGPSASPPDQCQPYNEGRWTSR
jgi:hypothetical protein